MLGIVLRMKKCYVDDVNYGLPPTPPGLRYDNGQLHIEEAMAIYDVLIAEDIRTMQIITAIGNSIHESTQLEYDCASLQDENADTRPESGNKRNQPHHARVLRQRCLYEIGNSP